MQTKLQPRTWGAIFSVALLSLLGIMTETSMNVTYPELSRLFHISLDTTQWITTAYLLMVTIMMGTTAYLLKRYQPQRLQFIAVIAFMVGDVLCAVAPSFGLLLLGRLVQATATGLATPILFHIIFTQVPRAKLGMMTGLAGMIISLAPALGPTYGGWISSTMSWRMIFWFLLPFGLVSLVGGQIFIRGQVAEHVKPFSLTSFIALALAMTTWIFALSVIGKQGLSLKFWGLLVVALVLFGLFVWLNQRGDAQLVNLAIFQHRAVVWDALSYFGLQFLNIGISVVIPVYAQYVLGANALVAGAILLPGTLVGAAISPIAGHLADQHGFALPVGIGSGLLVAGAGLFLAFQSHLSAGLLAGFFLVLRSGFNFSFSNAISNATTNVPISDATDISSVFNMVQQLAGATGVVFLTSLMAIFQNRGQGSLAARTYQGGHVDFWIMMVLAILLAVIALLNYSQQRKVVKA
ncbi:MAG TPA: MFS transporter [Candidatus Levilactobacillus faecigallinarum]|uniref:MFS transporter n=1 Tax=Candidatus Levilactobacillus faecigallinarum TaxID=2838638 RepID=A0A9D1QQV7_9LACO|nr:MFS transporter [Candidatus Levilactobacillus faecigallinarum]